MAGVELYDLKIPETCDPDIERLRQEYRTLSSALAVTSVLDRWDGARCRLEPDDPENLKTKLLNAVTPYMSRNNENVAAVSHASSTPKPELQLDVVILETSKTREKDSDIGHENSAQGIFHQMTGIRPCKTKDVSHWDSVLNGDWHGLIINDNQPQISLGSHLMTLVDYLENIVSLRHDATDNLETSWGLADKFHRYVFATCWPKMWRRIRHPISQGLIYELHDIPDTKIRSLHAS
ncbi:hypothetical protein BD410DRAFT_57821 [Rickenella mellea]|uniref:Uncharacterized protein n=1 Tax=Rickenella mellea TaxID=50990 RepID=A0A4Y7QBR3_9AGAM|nr:hypothetical protein BD410DRAFT_57821 [Rickenella mellea]